MKKLLLLSAVCFVAGSVSAADLRPYVEGRLANTWSKSKFSWADEGVYGSYTDHSVLGGALAVGTAIDQFRVEVEGFYNGKEKGNIKPAGMGMVGPQPIIVPGQRPDMILAKSELTSKGFFINGYYDFASIKGFRPFVGAGVGYSWLRNKQDTGRTSFTFRDRDFGYNVGFGVSYDIQENTAVTLGYRYENLGTLKYEGSKTEFKGYKLSLGLRYTF